MTQFNHRERSKNAKFWRSRKNRKAYAQNKMKGVKKFRPNKFLFEKAYHCPACGVLNNWIYDARYVKKNKDKQIKNFCSACNQIEKWDEKV